VRYAGHLLRPPREKYIAEAFDPIIKFHKYKVYKHTAIREFYTLLRAVGKGETSIDSLELGGSVLEIRGPEVEGFTECGNS
jgi:hypothetical protein